MKINYIKILVLVLLNLLLVGAIYIGYQKIQEARAIKNYNQQFSKALKAEATEEKNRDSQIQKGIVGQTYVTAYYPTLNGEPIAIIKEKILADIGSIPQEEENNHQARELFFYHSEVLPDPFVGVHPYQIKRTQYKWKKEMFIKDELKKLPLVYLDDQGNTFQFSQLFTDLDFAKETLLTELRSQLVFLRMDDQQIEELLETVVASDMASWSFSYEKSLLSISLPVEIEGMETFDVPLSKLYGVINTDRLQPDDLTAYEAYQEQRHEKMVALTFDDGPDPTTTPQALEILKKYRVKGTFFMLGKNVSAYPEIAKQVRQAGHEIGNHSWNHPVLTKLSLDAAKREIMDTKEIIQKVTGVQTMITRPPYGSINSAIQYAVDQAFIMWDVDTLDWKSHNTNAILSEIKKQVKPGSIILMHDIHQTSINALPVVIEYLQSQGYNLVTIDELLDHQVESHRLYYSKN